MNTGITWTAENKLARLSRTRKAKTILGAVRAARAFAESDLYGAGKITIAVDGQVVRRDTRSYFGAKWEVEAAI